MDSFLYDQQIEEFEMFSMFDMAEEIWADMIDNSDFDDYIGAEDS